MRVLLLMRGAAGVGKSIFIKENGLEQYALSADKIRLMIQSPVMMPDGTMQITQNNDRKVWNMLYDILEERMKRGEFIVVDATNSKTQEINRYKDYAKTYRYRMYCVDFTDIPIEECKRRNKTREDYKIVPDEVIDKMYARFATQPIPAGIKVIKPNELDQIWIHPLDFSNYKRIHHIGDIHGCNTVLQEYLKDGLKDDELYIFCGDYIDRGLENVEVIKFLFSIMNQPNVILLEGNHERWLWYWAHGGTSLSPEFEKVTRKQLEAAELDTKTARMLYRKFGQCAYYTYGDKVVFVTHGGLSLLPTTNSALTKIATDQMIRGVGRYSEYEQVAQTWDYNMPKFYYQIFGHRNTEDSPITMSKRCFNLEGEVEFGGKLRVVVLDQEGFHPIEVQNTVFRKPEEKPVETEYTETEQDVMTAVDKMRKNRYITEKKFGDISSFNFSREAFYEKQWNEQTIKARGLFINTAEGKVVCRSYPKFFKVNERNETKFPMLQHKFKFPVTAYVKENGFLGMVSYDARKDDFFITTKSTPTGEFTDWMREAFNKRVMNYHELKEFVKQKNVTLVFECVDMEHDPHIIKYDTSHLFLLDIVKNSLNFEKYSYSAVVDIAQHYGFEAKKRACELQTWSEFKEWYRDVTEEGYLYDGHEIEGFVVEDSAGFMVKVKSWYYTEWKKLRGVAQSVFRSGQYKWMGGLITPFENQFYGFLQELSKQENHPVHIIELRDIFMRRLITQKNIRF